MDGLAFGMIIFAVFHGYLRQRENERGTDVAQMVFMRATMAVFVVVYMIQQVSYLDGLRTGRHRGLQAGMVVWIGCWLVAETVGWWLVRGRPRSSEQPTAAALRRERIGRVAFWVFSLSWLLLVGTYVFGSVAPH